MGGGHGTPPRLYIDSDLPAYIGLRYADLKQENTENFICPPKLKTKKEPHNFFHSEGKQIPPPISLNKPLKKMTDA